MSEISIRPHPISPTEVISRIPTAVELVTERLEPLPDSEVTTATEKHVLGPKGFSIVDELKPFVDKPLVVSTGETLPARTFMVVKGGDSERSDEIVVFGDARSKWAGMRNSEGVIDAATVRKFALSRPDYTHDVTGTVVGVMCSTNTRLDGFHYRVHGHTPSRSKIPQPIVITAEGTPRAEYKLTSQEKLNGLTADISRAKGQRERSVRVIKKAGALLGFVMALTPGGLVDKVCDATDSADSVVAAATASMLEEHADPDAPHDAGYPPEITNKGVDARNAKTQKYIDAVKQTMRDLDEHNYDAISERAQSYVERHPTDFMDKRVQQESQEKIQAATSLEELAEAVRSFSDFYGFKISFDKISSNAALHEAKVAVAEIVRETSSYPLSLTNYSDLDTIIITSNLSELTGVQQSEGVALGVWDGNEIMIQIQNPFFKVLQAVTMNTPVVAEISGGDMPGYGAVFSHEFAHSMGFWLFTPEYDESISMLGTVAADVLWNSAQAVSGYATTNEYEWSAEILSGVLNADRSDGLGHPDNGRFFTSKANGHMLAALAQLAEELEDPGIVDYFVAKNPRLMGRGPLDFGA